MINSKTGFHLLGGWGGGGGGGGLDCIIGWIPHANLFNHKFIYTSHLIS